MDTELSKLKLEFNNDVMKCKKFLLQAKTQTIHKLSKKAKQLKARKGSDEEKEKFKRKADTIVSEIFTIKKISHAELGKFAMRNFGNLSKIMDTPIVTKEKAMAKLLSHKCLKPKFQQIIEKFSCVPVDRLLEVDPRKERRKKRKEKLKLLEKSTSIANEDSVKDAEIADSEIEGEIVNSETENEGKPNKKQKKEIVSKHADDKSVSENEMNVTESANEFSENESVDLSNYDQMQDENEESQDESEEIAHSSLGSVDNDSLPDDASENELEQEFVPASNSKKRKNISASILEEPLKDNTSKKPSKKISCSIEEPLNEDKPIKPKHKPRRMFVDLDDDEIDLVKTEKTVDSFFVTDSGDNYMTVAIPRPPDIKPGTYVDENAANRRMRRAAMFGNDIIQRPRRPAQNVKQSQYSSTKPDYQKNEKRKGDTSYTNFEKKDNNNQKFNKYDKSFRETGKTEEKLHPSWEAKKKNTGVVAFQGRKVTFDD